MFTLQFFMRNSINYEVTGSCCEPSGEQDSNLLVTCGSLGVLLLFRRFNMILCVWMVFSKDVQRFHHNLISNCSILIASF